MTDSENFDDIVARFPFTPDDLHTLLGLCSNLVNKTGGRYADGTVDEKSRRQLVALTSALRSLAEAADNLAADRDPDDDTIPF